MKRSEPLRRSSRLRSAKRAVRKRNNARAARRYARDFGEEAAAVRAMPCLITGTTPSEPAHVTSRGAGGGRFDLVPLSPAMHRQQHLVGIETFAACYRLDLRAEADRIAASHEAPLGLRGVARVWLDRHAGALAEAMIPDYDEEALFGWVRRSIARCPPGRAMVAQRLGLSPEEGAELCAWVEDEEGEP